MIEPCVADRDCTPCTVFHYVLYGLFAAIALTWAFYEVRHRLAVRRARRAAELAALADRVHTRR